MDSIDKAGAEYWDDNWTRSNLPQEIDANNISLDNHVNLQLHNYFKKIIGDKRNFSVLEIGCANSIWPIYFYKQYSAKVYGLDYSETGCAKSRELLQYHRVPAEIYCADLFNPPVDLLQKFDLVVSFGVVEHFENTTECLRSCAAFVKPGGKLFTLIPNMAGIVGFIQKHVDRKVYDVHMPLTKQSVVQAHVMDKMSLRECTYFMSMNLSVVNSGRLAGHKFDRYLRHVLSGFSKLIWLMERYGIKIPENSLTSPYIVAIAEVG